jgi:MoaA/NifB/PqqE/SkfB family radical SAM enzyme
MNRLVVDLAQIFEQELDYLPNSLAIWNRLFPHLNDQKRTIQILRELFLRPYLTSEELSKIFEISKEDLKKIYLFIRSTKEIRDLFALSTYPYIIKVTEDLIKNCEHTLQILNRKTPFPLSKTMELFISNSCNANCKFCYRNGQLYADKKIDTQAFVHLINEFADLHGENLDISGGLEPLLSSSILEVIKAGLDRNLRVSLYTNGIALDKKGLVEYLLQIDKIRVSLNACDRESYIAIMGVDQFTTVKKNITHLVQTKKAIQSQTKIGISFLVFRENYKMIFDVIKLAQELKIDFLDLRSIHVTDMGAYTEEQRDELQSILRQVKYQLFSGMYGKLSISIADTFNFVDPDSDFLQNLRKDFINDLVHFRISVTPHGKIFALNVIAQPGREEPSYLLGDFSNEHNLLRMLKNKKSIPFEPELFLPHDISLLTILPKLKSDLSFGITLTDNPFNFSVPHE